MRDNAVGALGRLALGHGAALPLDGIVTAMLAQAHIYIYMLVTLH